MQRPIPSNVEDVNKSMALRNGGFQGQPMRASGIFAEHLLHDKFT
jgi:hypothetical protein